MSWKQKFCQFLRSLHGVSIFYSIWVLLKFIFTLGKHQKTVDLLKKEKNNWDLLHARLNSHYKAWNYKKKIKAQKD